MTWFKDLKLTWKLACVCLPLAASLAAVGWMGISGQEQINANLERLYDRDMVGVVEILRVAALLRDMRLNVRQQAISDDAAELETNHRLLREHLAKLMLSLEQFEKRVLLAETKTKVAEVRRNLADYVRDADEVHQLALAHRLDAVKLQIKKGAPFADRAAELISEIVDVKLELGKKAYDESAALYAMLRERMIAALLAALLGGILLALLVSRTITRSLDDAVEVLQRVSAGDFTREVEINGKDEVGALGLALNQTIERVRETLVEVNTVALDVASASLQLTRSSEQIASGAQATASNLEETAASLEEITSTVRQNADNAGEADKLAGRARDAAERGGRVVEQTVVAMAGITEASTRIAEIITTIDEIAFQTNLLALNAAVEAARAGEQGRGFAVVASEVRNLAQRSATSSKEIKALINDTVAKVEGGSKQVNASGETLKEIISSVQRLTDVIGEIAAGSREQSGGIEQVNQAVNQMDQATQSNAAQTEELSATASGLSQQADNLRALVQQFEVGQLHAAARPPEPARAGAPDSHLGSMSRPPPARQLLRVGKPSMPPAPGGANHSRPPMARRAREAGEGAAQPAEPGAGERNRSVPPPVVAADGFEEF